MTFHARSTAVPFFGLRLARVAGPNLTADGTTSRRQPSHHQGTAMSKTITVQVINIRLLFRCPACRARQNMAILPNIRQKSVVCHACQHVTRCLLNRRAQPREPQAGKILMVTADNRETEVTLHDISMAGAGFDLPPGTAKSFRIGVGSHIRFKCTWNPRLFGSHTYEVQSIIGQRVGVKRV